jgi:CelD/BcsL family acetyltransferase involved in cellulose biosynthesis
VAAALVNAGLAPTVAQHELAAVLDLPDTFDDYLASIGKKERHELRRKRRRFEHATGPATLQRSEGPGAVALFADLHRRSAGDKGTFMTPEMEQFFLALHNDAGGVIDILLDGSGRPAAAVFSFEDAHATYLYNSAFEPDLGNLSPGNVVLSFLIEAAIAAGRDTFDFLKGDEAYKFRLGARPRPLFEVSATSGVVR